MERWILFLRVNRLVIISLYQYSSIFVRGAICCSLKHHVRKRFSPFCLSHWFPDLVSLYRLQKASKSFLKCRHCPKIPVLDFMILKKILDNAQLAAIYFVYVGDWVSTMFHAIEYGILLFRDWTVVADQRCHVFPFRVSREWSS